MQHRKEIIALTSEASKLEVSDFLESKGDTVYMPNFWDPFFASLFFDEKSQKWLSGSSLRFPPTISLEDFLAQNTITDEKPKWVFETDRQLKDFVADFLASKSETFELFLGSKRFSLQAVDGVVTDPEQVVFHRSGDDVIGHRAKDAAIIVGRPECWISKEAAESDLKIGTRFLSLGDMVYDQGENEYWIDKHKAEELFEQRNGK